MHERASLAYALSNKEIIFWDFDGVIKDSVNCKSDAFQEIFSRNSANILEKIKTHHMKNGGVSRYEKIPLYMKWSSVKYTPEKFEKYCNEFSKIVVNQVINSQWVPGIQKFLATKSHDYINIITTATPDDEIKRIIKTLMIENYFQFVSGSGTSKKKCIKNMLSKCNIRPEKAIMIGDSLHDFEAARYNEIDFILRKTDYNSELISQRRLNYFENFL